MDSKDLSRYYNRRILLAERRRKRDRGFEAVQDDIHGIVFAINGSIYADRAQNYVWVHEWGINASQAQAYLPPYLNVWEGAGVIMQRNPKSPYPLEIIKVHASPYPRAVIEIMGSEFGRAQIGPHGANHQYPTEATVGPDPVLIWHSAIQIFKSVVTTGLSVQVGPMVYEYGGERLWFPRVSGEDTIDLTPYLPSAGTSVRVLIYLDASTKSLQVKVSDESTTGFPGYPKVPNGGIPSAYFYLEDTYTSLSMVDDYLDARRWFVPSHNVEEVFLSAAGGWPSITNGCGPQTKRETTTNKQNFYTLDFDQTTVEYAEWTIWMPHDWDGGPIAARFMWSSPTGSGDVAWGIQGAAYVDGSTLDIAWGTAQTVIDTLVGNANLSISDITNAIALSGSPGAGSPIQIRVFRDTSIGGNLPADARLNGVKLYYTKAVNPSIDLYDLTTDVMILDSVTADAYIVNTTSGSVSADATVETTESGSVTADADIA